MSAAAGRRAPRAGAKKVAVPLTVAQARTLFWMASGWADRADTAHQERHYDGLAEAAVRALRAAGVPLVDEKKGGDGGRG